MVRTENPVLYAFYHNLKNTYDAKFFDVYLYICSETVPAYVKMTVTPGSGGGGMGLREGHCEHCAVFLRETETETEKDYALKHKFPKVSIY